MTGKSPVFKRSSKRAPKKYKCGRMLTDMNDVVKHMRQFGGRDCYFWWRGKPYHPGVVLSWQFRMLKNMVYIGELFEAEITKEYQEWSDNQPF